MIEVKYIEVEDITDVTPQNGHIAKDTTSGLLYLGTDDDPTPLKTTATPFTCYNVGDADYTLSGNEEIIFASDVYDIIFDGHTGYRDGFKVTIKNIAGADITVRVATGDSSLFEGAITNFTLANLESKTIVKYGSTYYFI